MYELVAGSGRLTTALYLAARDPARLNQLAELLHYQPEQLPLDIEAVVNYFEHFRGRAIQEQDRDSENE